ncbi:hypothetical protein TNCV_4695941 [Trichonephila clavipes]|nr:hypothetical protein TNCV_4695941 [Trichonephila clavipes]
MNTPNRDYFRLSRLRHVRCSCGPGLSVFEKIVVKHLSSSLRLHTSRRRRLRESIRRKRHRFRQSDKWYLLNDNAPAHRSKW